MTTAAYWKSEINDLRSRAEAVMTSPTTVGESMTARTAARVLHGIMSLVARRWSVDEMQRTCAVLVRHNDAWTTRFGLLPHDGGAVSEPTQLIAVVCRGLVPLAGSDNLRSALSFWATESDPGVWSELVGG